MADERKAPLAKKLLKEPIVVTIVAAATWVNENGTLGGWQSPKASVTIKGTDPLTVSVPPGGALYAKVSSVKGFTLGADYVAGAAKTSTAKIF